MSKRTARTPAARPKQASVRGTPRRTTGKPVSSRKPARQLAAKPKAKTGASPGHPRRPEESGPSPRGSVRLAQPPAPSAAEQAHAAAVTVYERGLQALQSRQYDKAIQLLQSVIDLYGEEKELHERARLYLNVALRNSRPPDSTPRSQDERVYGATLLLNEGRYDDALRMLEGYDRDIAPSDHVEYVLAMVHVHRGDFEEALRHLVRAIELDPANRAAALQDSELAPLRESPGFREAIERAAMRGRRSAGRSSR